MKPPTTYFGGKTRLADWVATLLPPHEVYIEPFFGSGALFFSKGRVRHELINDRSGHVVNFFTVLRDRPGDLDLACRLTPYARDEFEAADPGEPGIDALERARRWWVLSLVVISGYSSELYDEILADWHRIDRRVARYASNGRSTGPVPVTETIWSNRPLHAQGTLEVHS